MQTPPTPCASDPAFGGAGGAPLPGPDVAALLAELLEEQRKQTELLKRSLYGRLQQLTADDVMAILGIGRTKLGEMVDDGVIPMYRLGGPTGPRRISAEALERVIRAWAERRP